MDTPAPQSIEDIKTKLSIKDEDLPKYLINKLTMDQII